MKNKTEVTEEDYGCQPFKVMLPRKAVSQIKAKHKNVGAFIRGLIADELGVDWPLNDLKIHNPAKPGYREELKVIRPSRRKCAIQTDETYELPGIPAPPKRPKLARHRRVNSVSNSLQTLLRNRATQQAEQFRAGAETHSDPNHDPFEGLDLEAIAEKVFRDLHMEMDSKTES